MFVFFFFLLFLSCCAGFRADFVGSADIVGDAGGVEQPDSGKAASFVRLFVLRLLMRLVFVIQSPIIPISKLNLLSTVDLSYNQLTLSTGDPTQVQCRNAVQCSSASFSHHFFFFVGCVRLVMLDLSYSCWVPPLPRLIMATTGLMVCSVVAAVFCLVSCDSSIDYHTGRQMDRWLVL